LEIYREARAAIPGLDGLVGRRDNPIAGGAGRLAGRVVFCCRQFETHADADVAAGLGGGPEQPNSRSDSNVANACHAELSARRIELVPLQLALPLFFAADEMPGRRLEAIAERELPRLAPRRGQDPAGRRSASVSRTAT
jgi:hypothetical protein